MGDHRKRLGQGSREPTRQAPPPRRQFEETRLSARPPSNDLPTPEFLSLTYTLPYHLVEQVNETARVTNRSRSEILADAIRQYMDNGAAQPERSQIATYEEHSYQETAAPNAASRYDSPEHQQTHEISTETVSESTRTEFKAWAARTKRTRVSTYESYSYEEVSNDHLGQAPQAHEAPPVLDVTPEEATPPTPAPAATQPAAPEPAPAPAPEPEAAPKAEAEAEVVAKPELVIEPEVVAGPEPVFVPELIADPEPAAPTAPEPEPESASEPEPAAEIELEQEPEPEPVAAAEPKREPKPQAETEPIALSKEPVAAATKPTTATEPTAAPGPTNTVAESSVDKVADPAAHLRKRLAELAREPLESQPLERCLAEIMCQIDKKDFSPPDHSSKVATMARDLAAAKGMRGHRLHEVYIAGLVHDIGKACVPDEIIKKPKPSSAEMALIRRYPEFGADLLSAIPAMKPVAQIVAAHQERWNGSGYPQGSVRTEIPVAAQIVALCDVYNVLNTARRYRPAYSQDRALQIIKQNVGTLWNPDIARVFLIKIVGEGQQLRAGARG